MPTTAPPPGSETQSLLDAAFETARSAPGRRSSFYVAGPLYDNVLLIFSPLIALLLGALLSGADFADRRLSVLGHEGTPVSIGIGVFIMAHLSLVFLRSHVNSAIFAQYPSRFTWVPIALFTAMSLSPWIAVSVGVLATWWDVYHSSLQTFGIGRIYDMKRGNDPSVGRRLDWWLNLYLYAGPILAGATLMPHVADFSEFESVGALFFTRIPAYVDARSAYLTWAVTCTGVPFLVFYVYRYWRLYTQGYKISFQKTALLVSTALCSIWAWGFNSFGEAFFIMNFFHALQYFAIVWWMEKGNLVKVLGLRGRPGGKFAALGLMLLAAFIFGVWAEFSNSSSALSYNVVIVVAIMHFWYDGFIWSVRKAQV